MDRESCVSEGEEYIYGRRVNCTNYTYVPGMECYFVPTAEVMTELTALIERRTTETVCGLLRQSSTTKTKKVDAQTQTLGKRMRSSENWTSPDTMDSHGIKYRKVNNRFSEVVTRSDEDDLQLIGNYLTNQKFQEQHYVSPNSSSIDMPQLRSSNSFGMQKNQTTSYTIVDFSDDVEFELTRGVDKCEGDDRMSGSKSPRVFNIPIRRNADERIKPTVNVASQRCEAFDASILAASWMPEGQSPRTPSCADSSSSSAIDFSWGVNGTSSIKSTNAISNLKLWKFKAERERYNQQLEQVMQTSATVGKSDILSRFSLENFIGNTLASQAESSVPLPSCAKLRISSATAPEANEKQQKTAEILPYVEPANSLLERLNKSPYFKSNWLEQTMQKWNAERERFDREIEQAKKDIMIARDNTREHEVLYYGLTGRFFGSWNSS